MILLILINKAEAEKIRERYPLVNLTRTCIQKSKRHRYYLPENDKYLRIIRDTNIFADEILKEREKLNPKKNGRKKRKGKKK